MPVEIKTRKGTKIIDTDDHLRPETTLESLAKLPTAFSKDGFVTAGNASGIVDGAAALVIAGEEYVKERREARWPHRQLGHTPASSRKLWASAPCPPSRKALGEGRISLAEIDLIEVNEAFAAQYLAVEKELGLDRARTNVNGGAIALGHPLAASGTRLVLTVLLELKRRGGRYGLATACIGGGQGIAIICESL